MQVCSCARAKWSGREGEKGDGGKWVGREGRLILRVCIDFQGLVLVGTNLLADLCYSKKG